MEVPRDVAGRPWPNPGCRSITQKGGNRPAPPLLLSISAPHLGKGVVRPSPVPWAIRAHRDVLSLNYRGWHHLCTKPRRDVRWKQPLRHAAFLFTGEKKAAQISGKIHICILVTASAICTLQHKRRQCEGLCFSSPTFPGLSSLALAAFK